jgi:hypothetical protein
VGLVTITLGFVFGVVGAILGADDVDLVVGTPPVGDGAGLVNVGAVSTFAPALTLWTVGTPSDKAGVGSVNDREGGRPVGAIFGTGMLVGTPPEGAGVGSVKERAGAVFGVVGTAVGKCERARSTAGAAEPPGVTTFSTLVLFVLAPGGLL